MGKVTQQPPTNKQKSFDALVTQANEAAKAQKIKTNILGGTDDTVTFGGYSYGARGFGKAAKEGNWSNWSLPTDMLARAYDEQDAGEMMKEMGIGFTKQLAAGFLDSIGAWDASNITQSNYRNGEIEYSNWFNKMGSKLRKDAQEENQIYQDPSGSMWNGAYFANQVQQLGYTGGIISEMVLENLALDAITGGGAAAGSVASKAGLLARVGKDALFGMAQGIKEAHMNALETQNNVFQKFVQAGYSEDEALEKSKEAARLHFKTESGALMAMNAVQNVMFLGSLSRAVRGRGVDTAFTASKGLSLGFSDAFQTVGDKLAGRLTSGIEREGLRRGINRAVGVGLLAGSESIEEGIQTAIGKYSANTVEGKDTSWQDIWSDNEMRDSMIGGALGGLLMGAGFKAVANYRNRDFNKNYKNFLQDTLNRSKQAFENEDVAYNEYKAAEQAYTDSTGDNTAENTEARSNYEKAKLKYQQAQEASHLVNAVNALRFDHAKKSGSTVAFDMYTQHMEDVLDAVNTQNTDTLKQFGLLDSETGKERFEGSLKSIAETYEGRIQDAQKLKELYSETLNRTTGDFDIATPIVQNKFGIYKNNQEVESYRQDIENSYNGIEAFGQLSPQAQARLRLIDEKRGLELNDEVKESMYGQMRLQEIEAELENYPTAYSAQDRRILNESGLGSAREGNMMSQFGHMVVGELIRSNEKLASQIDSMSKPSEIKKAIEENRKKYIKRAKTRAEVVEAVQEAAQEDGVVSTEVQQAAEDRMNELVVQENLTQQEAEQAQPVANISILQEATRATDQETAEQINYALEQGLGEVDDISDILGQATSEEKAQASVFESRQGGTDLLNNINKMVSNLDNFYQRGQARQSDLRDFIHEMIHHVGLDGVKNNYPNLVKAYNKATQREITNQEEIFNDIYRLPSQILEDLSEDQVNDMNEVVETQVKENLGKKETNTDGDTRVITIDVDRRTNSSNLKAAHNYQVSQRDTNGEWTVTEDNLKAPELINNLYALDNDLINDLYNNNTELEIRPVDDSSATVSFYSGGQRQTMTWGQMKSRIGSNREAWYNNVPMVAYLGDTPLFNIHSPMWYNESNISEKEGKDVQAQIIKDGVSNLTDLRQRVQRGENKIKISDYRFGNVDKINEHINKQPRTILEATGGTSTLAVVTASAQGKEFMISGTESLLKKYPNSMIVDDSLLDKLKPGELIEFREIGIDKTSGKTLLFPARVLNYSPLAEGNMKQDLQESIFNNVKYSTLAYLLFENQSNEAIRVGVEQQFNFNLTDAEDLRNQILQGTGIDIKFQAGDYVNLFLQNTKLSDRNKQNMAYFENTNYLNKTKGRQIQGLDFFYNQEKTFTIGKVDSGYENTLLRNIAKFFNDSEGQGALMRKAKFSVNKKGLGDSTFMIPQVDNTGKVQGQAQSYTDFAKSNLYTNLLSHEIETMSGERKWITDIQPMIYFESVDSNGNSIPDAQAESNPIMTYEIDVNDQASVTSESLDVNLRQQLLDAGLSEEDIKVMIANGTLSVTSDSIFESRLIPSEQAVRVFDALSTNKISSLTEQEHKDLVQSLKNNIIANLDFTKKIYLADVARAATTIVEDTIVPIIDQTRSRIANLSKVPSLAPFVAKEQAYLNKLETIITEKEKLIRFTKQEDESGNVLEVGDIIREFNKLLGTRVEELDELNTEEIDSETTDQYAYEAEDENYSKSALEKNVKLSFTNELRLKLLGIPLQKSVTREAVLNTLGLPQYNSADEVLLRLQEITTSVRSDWSQVMDKLEQRYAETKKPIYIQIRDQFKNLEEHIQNQLLHKLIQEPVTLYKVLISEETANDGSGQSFVTNTTTTILDENSSRESLTLAKQLQNDFVFNQNNNLGYVVSDSNANKRLDLDYTRAKQEQLQKLIDANLTRNNIPVAEVNKLFNEYGLYRIKENSREKYILETNPFEAKRGILFFINEQLKDLITRENEARAKKSNLDMSLRENSIFAKANSALNKLIATEIALNGSDVAKSIRVDGKTLQGASNTTMIQDTLNSLKEGMSGRLMPILSQVKLSQDNFILKLLLEDESFRKNTQLSWTSPDFIKKHNRDNFSSAEIDSLGQLDYISSLLATYSNQKGFSKLTNSDSLYRGLKFRLAQMTTTTFADKGRMMLWTTAVVDAQRGQIEFDASGNVRLNPILGGFLFEQLFKPEFNRIVESYQMTKNNAPSNIIGYDAASKVFLGLPMFNNLTITLDGQEINILTAIDKGLVDPERYRQSAINALENMLSYNLNKKINQEGTQGVLVDIGMYNPNAREIEVEVQSQGETGKKKIKESPFKNINDAFINGKPGENDLERFRFAMVEFEINTILNQNNIYSLFLGDQAFYSKDKFVKNAIKSKNFSDLSEAISLIIDKRAAMLIAPGAKYANSEVKGLQDIGTQYHQIFVNDVEGMSNYIDRFLESQYGEMTEGQKNLVSEIKIIDNQIQSKYDQFNSIEDTQALEQEISDLMDQKDSKVSELSNTAPDIADYFAITGTDAQEYSTWRSHLDALYRKGDLTTAERDMVRSAYEKLSAGNFSEVTKEEYAIVMQPLKTVYTGIINYTNPTTGAVLARPIYIKSSTIPLLPHVTQGLKLDEVRKKLEAFENKKGTLVKMSYQTANKIGATKTRLTMNDLYYKSMDSLYSQVEDTQGNIQEKGLLAESMVTLPTTGLRIQQETPYKQGKYFAKGEDPHISMGSQFMKVIMGNGINQMGNIFTTDYFNSAILQSAGLDPNNTSLDGRGLEKIYTQIYKEYSNVNKQILFDEFGIDPSTNFTDLSADEQFEVLTNLVKVLESEITGRGYPDYMQDSLVVLKEEILKDKEAANLNMPLLFDSNANKFESLMQSIVSNRLISHKLPGNGHISASSEGFSRKTTLDAISASDRSGIVWIDGPVNDLSPTYIDQADGRRILVKSKVLIPSHFAYTDRSGNRQYVDFTSDEYSTAIVENGVTVGRRLNMDKIEPELLSMFAFRIPTSSHQSGTLIEVAGFLPSTMGDSLVVPKEHTTQLGEDYDIDKRYVYKNNYFVDRSGVIRKTQYVSDNITPEDNKSTRLFKNKQRLLGLENGLIDVYKTVFNSTDPALQKKVYKPLVTEIADRTANLIQAKQRQDSTENRDYFTNLSDEYQFYLMKLGADGKGAIGQHSNGVTMQAQFDRATNKVRLLDPTGSPRVIRFGNIIVSDGILGNSSKAINSEYDVADQHGENQNVGTDNINKQIMIKRNENSYTMSVYATMAFRKIYTTPEKIRTGIFENGKEIIAENLSLPSLFMSQPILVDYVKLRSKYDSITGDFMSRKDINNIIIRTLSQKYGFKLNQANTSNDSFTDIDPLHLIWKEDYEQGQNLMTGQRLFDNITESQALKNPLLQAAVLQHFYILLNEAETLQKYNALINLSTSKLGVSNFNNIQRINLLNNIAFGETEGIENIDSLIGNSILTGNVSLEEKAQLKEQGYIEIGEALWQPTTIEGTMLINSLQSANNVVETLFPYKASFVENTINTIFENNDKDPNKKSQAGLEWKYEIMNSMRDFMYTLKSANMFTDVDNERQRLFMDNGINKSLASIINQLKIDNNDIILNNTLLRDLEVTVRYDGLPSLIQHFAASNESFDKSVKYEAFKNLLVDNKTVLGTFNNEEYTPRKLAFDLAAYAYIADTQRGASSFRNYIHYSFLEQMGITKGMRKIYYALQNENIQGIMPLFIEQYFQHNPNKASIMSAKTYDWNDFKEMNSRAKNAKSFERALQNLDSFVLTELKYGKNRPEFISIRDTSQAVTNKNKKFKLFKRGADGVYNMIDVLGDAGFNEYNANQVRNKSKETILIKDARAQETLKVNNLVAKEYADITKQALVNLPIFQSLHTVEGTINSFLAAESFPKEMPALYNFLSQAKDILYTDIPIVFENTIGGGLGEYQASQDRIVINPSAWEMIYNRVNGNMVKARTALRELFIEEIIHANTVKEFKKYVESEDRTTGVVTLKSNAPAFATRLVALYEAARSEVPYDPSDISTYYSKDVYEFMAGMFVAEDYRQRVEAKSPGIVQRFLDALRNLFRSMYTNKTGETLDYKSQMFNDVRELIKTYSESMVAKPTTSEQENVDYNDMLNNNPGEDMMTRDQLLEDDNFDARQNFTIFAEEAFRCK